MWPLLRLPTPAGEHDSISTGIKNTTARTYIEMMFAEEGLLLHSHMLLVPTEM